jgi:homoserine dehydrogenase
VGKVMFYGRGAGKMPTASAVVADILDVAKSNENKGYFWEEEANMVSYENMSDSYFVRIAKADEEKIKKAMPDAEVIMLSSDDDEFAVITKAMTNASLDEMLKDVKVIKKIRVVGEDE